MQYDESESLWIEKYRPSTIDDCILPANTKKMFNQFITDGEIPNLLLAGAPGTGKTTAAIAMCNELGADWMIINGSNESGIDVLRTKIMAFASTVSLLTEGKPKVVIIDEADYLNPNSTQPAFRGFIEEFSNNCRFIFTCNYKNRIIEPLRVSRLANIDFVVSTVEKPKLMSQFMKRIQFVLDNEGVSYDNKVIAEIIQQKFPDYRRIINEFQSYSAIGKIDVGILASFNDVVMDELMSLMSQKKWGDMKKWVSKNSDIDQTTIFRKLYDNLYKVITPESVPQSVMIIGEYQYRAAFVADAEINIVSCLTEMMGSLIFK